MTVAGLLSIIKTKPLKVVFADAVLKIAFASQDVPASYSNLFYQRNPNL